MIAKQKKALREHYRQVRDALLPDERLAQSQEICTQIMQTELYAQAQSVLLYAAQGSEIDLSTLARDAWEKGKTVAYPRCLDGQGHMAFYTVDAPERLVPGKFSIPEPDEHHGVFWSDKRHSQITLQFSKTLAAPYRVEVQAWDHTPL